MAVVILCTFFGWLAFGRLHDPNIITLYLLGIVVVAVLHGRGPSILASVLGVAAFDFFFVPPYLTFAVLVRHAGKVLTHRQLLKEVWGPSHIEENHYLRIYMAQLRHKIESDPARVFC